MRRYFAQGHFSMPSSFGVRQNLKEILGSTCWKRGSFPLSLETVFPVLFGFDHPLAGKDHHALANGSRGCSTVSAADTLVCRPVPVREPAGDVERQWSKPGPGEEATHPRTV